MATRNLLAAISVLKGATECIDTIFKLFSDIYIEGMWLS